MIFQGSRGGGGHHLPGLGVQILIPMETYRACDYLGGGVCPPLCICACVLPKCNEVQEEGEMPHFQSPTSRPWLYHEVNTESMSDTTYLHVSVELEYRTLEQSWLQQHIRH